MSAPFVGVDALLSVPPFLFVVAALVLVAFLPRREAHLVTVVALLGTVAWALLVPEGTGPTWTFLGLEIVIVDVNVFSRLMVIIFGAFGASAVGYAYFADASNRHLMWGLGYVGASLWTVVVGDWLGLILGWEAMAIASTIFVWLSGGRSIRTGYRYALAHAIGGSLLLAGIALYLFTFGTNPDPTVLHFDGTGIGGMVVDVGVAEISAPAAFAGVGIGVNAAIIGLHSWLPDTYPSPHVATSVFLACYTTKTAVYAAHRAFPDGNMILAYAGGAMAIYGAAYALAQKDMRRLLSYHIQGQVGFMLAGLGVGSALGVAGGFAHLFNHILYKGLLFMAAGIIILQLNKEDLGKFGAIGTSAPIALGAFLVGALSISGVPGFNGFVSKGMLTDAAEYGGHEPLFWLLVIGGVGTYASFIKFGYYAFIDGESFEMPDANLGHAVVAGSVAAACVVLGLFYQPLFALLPLADQWSTDPYSSSHILKALGMGVGGVVAFVAGKPIFDRLHGGVDVNRAHDPAAFYGTRALSGGLGGLYNAVGDFVVATGWKLVGAVHDPGTAIRGALPAGWRDRYDQRLASTAGTTGFKFGIARTMYVATGLLTVVLAVALFIDI